MHKIKYIDSINYPFLYLFSHENLRCSFESNGKEQTD